MSTEALQDLLRSSFESQMSNVHTAIPCVVVNVRNGLNGQMVDIQPTVNQLFQDGTTKERPPLLGIPVAFQVSKLSGFTFPIRNGDTGMAIFSMRSMDAWKAGNGRPSTPLNYAKMDKGDAIFLPGIQPPGIAVNNPSKHVLAHDTNDAVLFHNLGTGNEVELRLKLDGSVEINTTNKPVTINCSDAIINSETVQVNTNIATVDCITCDITGTTEISLTAPKVNING